MLTADAVEFFFERSLVLSQPHALRVVPFIAAVALNVKQVGVQGLQTDAESLPVAKGRL